MFFVPLRPKPHFVACDFPEASPLTLHIMAAVAEHEAKAISVRTRAALAQAKARGMKLGNPNLTNEGRERGSAAGIRSIKEHADAFATRVLPTIRAFRETGMSLSGTARELNAIGIKTARGKRWTAQAVKNVLLRGW